MDAFVGRHLFDHALIGNLGQSRTRILVTHHIDLVLPATKYLISLGDGTIKFAGSPRSLEESGELERIINKPAVEEPALSKVTSNDDDRSLTRLLSAASHKSHRIDSGLNDTARKVPRKFVEDETKEKGVIKRATWTEYISSSGGKLSPLPSLACTKRHARA